MTKIRIRQLLESRIQHDGLTETGVPGVRLFRATQAIPCAPAIYEPCVMAIVSGSKEAVLEGTRYVYDSAQYLCCPMSMPVMAGTPAASPQNPLYGVFLSLNPRVMTELAAGIRAAGKPLEAAAAAGPGGIRLAQWDAAFTDALLRVLDLLDRETDAAVLGEARLRELYYAVLRGQAGGFAQHAFDAGNAIARTIAHVSSHLDAPVSIDEMAARAGLSRAVFHRRFKQATALSPIQFVKSMRLNNAAVRIAEGTNVSQAAMDVGYVSPSQFSREFRRMFGQSPRQWCDAQKAPAVMSSQMG